MGFVNLLHVSRRRKGNMDVALASYVLFTPTMCAPFTRASGIGWAVVLIAFYTDFFYNVVIALVLALLRGLLHHRPAVDVVRQRLEHGALLRRRQGHQQHQYNAVQQHHSFRGQALPDQRGTLLTLWPTTTLPHLLWPPTGLR